MKLDEFYPNCDIPNADVLVSYNNEGCGVKAEVTKNNDSFTVRVIDTDANLMFPFSNKFATLPEADAYAKTCV